jgi:hypothetical protein
MKNAAILFITLSLLLAIACGMTVAGFLIFLKIEFIWLIIMSGMLMIITAYSGITELLSVKKV